VSASGSPVDAVSAASALYDGGKRASPAVIGVLDGAQLRARHRARLAVPAPVTILQGRDARELGRAICEASVPRRPPATPVLIKPNLGGFESVKDPDKSGGDDGLKGRITDPEFVRGIIGCLRARGHAHITVADGWGGSHTGWMQLARVSGYEAMTRDEHVDLVAMNDDGVFDAMPGTPGKPLRPSGMEGSHVPTLLVPQLMADHLRTGLFITAPKIKAHRFAVFSGAIKGMQGVVMLSDAAPAYRQKWRMHAELNPYLAARRKGEDDRGAYVSALELFSERMVDVLELEAPDVVLAEGAPMMGGDGFGRMYASRENLAVGGSNAVQVDHVIAQLLGLWDLPELAKELGGHATSPLLEAAELRFALRGKSPMVVGDGAPLLAQPRPVHYLAMAPFAIHRDLPDRTASENVDADANSDFHAKASGDGNVDANAHPRSETHPQGVDAGASALPRAHIVRGVPRIDAVSDDEVWRRAEALSFATDFAGASTSTATVVRLAWSPDGLAALFEMKDSHLFVDTNRPTDVERPRLYQEDCVELFIAPPGRADPPSTYYEVEVGPYGHFFDLALDRAARREDTAWSGHLTIATQRDTERHTATIELLIQAPEITRALAPGAVLRGNIFRMEGKSPRHYLAWSPPRTPKPNFHVPTAFGFLECDP